MFCKHRFIHLLWVVLNVNVVDWFGQRVLSGYAVIFTVYCVSAWSPGICPVVPTCLGTMTLPFVQETSYSMLKALLADGRDQARMAVGGMPLTRVGASGGPGQTVAYNNTQAHHSSCMIVLAHYTIVYFTEIL